MLYGEREAVLYRALLNLQYYYNISNRAQPSALVLRCKPWSSPWSYVPNLSSAYFPLLATFLTLALLGTVERSHSGDMYRHRACTGSDALEHAYLGQKSRREGILSYARPCPSMAFGLNRGQAAVSGVTKGAQMGRNMPNRAGLCQSDAACAFY